jgi:hypothetical protein
MLTDINMNTNNMDENNNSVFINKINIEDKLLIFKKYLDRTNMDHKQYQYDGVKWCLNNELGLSPLHNVRGGLIADEMGLGKTIMMIGLCCANIVPKTLIVLPPILIDQWYLQIYKTTGHRALVYYGEDKKYINLNKLDSVPIVITSYAHISVSKTQMKEKDELISLLHQVKWNRIIFDEAHHLRNSNTRSLIGAKLLKSDIRWLVSGTPIQNKKKDFYNLCSVIGYPASFYTNIDNLIKFANSFILKRTKKKVGIQMTDIVMNKEIVKWKSNKEMELAQDIHAGLEFSNVTGGNGGNFDYHKLVLMIKAKQSCVLPKLMFKTFEDLNFYKEALSCSSKLDSVVEAILENKDNGNGKLIFCQFREEIDEIATRLRYGGMSNVVIMDGRTTNAKRKKNLENKNDAIILQIQTGCEGLNLQENYSEIYFVSPHWNPAIEDQAIARCHRIGQEKTVFVKRFEMCKFNQLNTVTIDKYVNVVQENKRNIINEYM